MILAFDTSVNACSVALLKEEKLVSQKMQEMRRGQAENLLVFVDEILSANNYSCDDLSAIAVTVGPGSFTGVRTGLSAAKTLGLALDIPVFGVPTTQAIAFDVFESEENILPILVVQETKRADFYFHLFDCDGKTLINADADMAQTVMNKIASFGDDFILTGDGAVRFASEISEESESLFSKILEKTTVVPEYIAKIAQKQIDGEFETIKPVPLYIRPADVNCKKA
jgi:tRNA threonylcarbamoyladenosine biosynthesis protein TsaB